MIALKDLFSKPDALQTAGAIIHWWEARRLHYNLFILVSALIVALIGNLWSGRSDHEIWKLDSLYAYLLFFQLPANIWYTGGWIVDLIVKKLLRLPSRGFGPWALAMGFAFSLLFYLAILVVSIKNSSD